jgi:hypothetical protein
MDDVKDVEEMLARTSEQGEVKMMPEYLTPLANHLWQSTFVAGVAALMALALRKNSARVRYWVWFAAAVKFLIPFSIFISIGHQFEWRILPAPIVQGPISAVTEISMPFADGRAVTVLSPVAARVNPLPVILLSLWLCSFAVSVWFWIRVGSCPCRSPRCSPVRIDVPGNDNSVRVMSSRVLLEPAVIS